MNVIRSTIGLIIMGTLATGCSAPAAEVPDAESTAAEAATEEAAPAADTQDIVDTAVAAGSFETLVAAVKAADLVEVLKGDGPFTVFAPTDEAFAALPAGTVEDLLKPENKDKLQAILKYHVVPGRVAASDVVNLTSADTVQGEQLSISASGDAVMINEAKVVKTDVQCSNGIIHVIDKVVLPKG